MKKVSLALALAGLLVSPCVHAISLDDIQLWTGSGTNRAALVIEWSVPESLTNSSVPVPVADKTLVWGYRFNGTATGTQMLHAILATDPKLYVVADESFGTFVEGIGYNLNGNGVIGITDGTNTDFITGGFLTNPSAGMDAAGPLNSGDLYWGGLYGPNWETWNETNDAGGFLSSPNRGTNAYWTTTDPVYFSSGTHGQWEFAQAGLDDLPLVNGSWIGFSVAAGEYEGDPNAPYNIHKHAPVSPDGTYAAYVCNTNDFGIQVISTNNIDPTYPYNDPLAVLGRPTLKFIDHFGGNQIDRSKIVEPPYWTDPNTNPVITEISSGGQITVKLGRKIYDDPNNPYGVDFIVYGNSFFSASGGSGFISDATDLSMVNLSSSPGGHPTTVSVSQDGVNWFSYPSQPTLFPDNAYRWDDTNAAWTEEKMNPTKPLNPFIYTNNFSGQSVALGLDQFVGAAGGSGYDLKTSGLPWIQYVRLQTDTVGDYTVIDAIGAVDPVAVGDALSILPDNVAAGATNLVFQNPANLCQNQISINFDFVNEMTKISTVSLNDFSSFAPAEGTVSSGYQIQARPVTVTNAVIFQADIGLRAGATYSGNGSDLRVFQWNCTNWVSQPFCFNTNNNEVLVTGVTNFSAFVVSQIIPPSLGIQTIANGFAFQFTPVPNCSEALERSVDLVTWTPLSTFTATNAQPITLQDLNVPADKAFYRVEVNP
jgi:hypothetical protein